MCARVLTWGPSQVKGVFGACQAALFGANAVLTDCINLELQQVVLLHHWRHTNDVPSSSSRWCHYHSDGCDTPTVRVLLSPVMVCQCPLQRGSSGVNEVEKSPVLPFTETVT